MHGCGPKKDQKKKKRPNKIKEMLSGAWEKAGRKQVCGKENEVEDWELTGIKAKRQKNPRPGCGKVYS